MLMSRIDALLVKQLVESLKQPFVDALDPIESAFNILVMDVDPLAPKAVGGAS